MRKFTTLLLAGAAMFALVSCDKENGVEPTPSVSADNYGQVVFEESLRAINEDQKETDNLTEEKAVNNAQLFTGTELTQITKFTANGSFYMSDVFEFSGTTGTLESGLVVNGSALGLAAADRVATKTISIDDLGKLVTSGKFVMSSKSNESKTIKDKVAKENVAPGNNLLDFEVERVVSKLQVSQPTAGIKVKDDAPIKGKVTGARYSLAGSANKVYLFKDKAVGNRRLTQDGTTGLFIYDGFESAIHSDALTTFTGTAFNVRRDLQKVSDLKLKTLLTTDTQFGTLNSLEVVADAAYDSASNLNGIYFLENSLPVKITAAGQVDYADIAHAKIYVTFEPDASKVYKWNAGTSALVNIVAADMADRIDEIEVTKADYDAASYQVETTKPADYAAMKTLGKKIVRFTDDNGTPADPADDKYYFILANTAKTFYRGADKILYLNLSDARKAGNAKTEKYVDGKMLFKTPANAQKAAADAAFHGYLDTRRNNIYSLQVTSISNLGLNYDPADPNDPNTPDPKDENPDEPEKDKKDPVDDNKNYLQVKATILPWNLVHREVEL
ncbi:MAG: Mfa1 family fimbria major subunit [Porphyromonas sp.]|nr:Mfa1 family fimbria major subunit [Porphyromonas sp.]